MPLDKLVLILVIVIAAAGGTVCVAAWVAASGVFPWFGLGTAIPLALIGYILARVIRDRMTSADDDHYGKVEK